MQPYSVVASNTAAASTNKIHDDEVAKQFGFRGGLVPGVDMYAYLTHPVVKEWGLEWLERGHMHAKFEQPVYDGDEVMIAPTGDGGLELRDPLQVCAVGAASFPVEQLVAPDPSAWPEVEQAADPPRAAPETLAPGTALGLAPHRFHADRAGEYLDAIRESHPIYADDGIAHPGWVLRDANKVLSANVQLGPWLHVESTVQHYGVVRDGQEVAARALVNEEFERKGHRFVTLDVLHLADRAPVARTSHTAIYQPRGA
jgi:hypothetical protein